MPGVPLSRRGAAAFTAGASAWPGRINLSRLSATCCATSGVPSWKRTPSRRRNDHTRPSLDTDQCWARAGSMSLLVSVYRTSVSKTWRAMRAPGPSRAAAGSMLAGTDGTPIRRTPGSASVELGSPKASASASAVITARGMLKLYDGITEAATREPHPPAEAVIDGDQGSAASRVGDKRQGTRRKWRRRGGVARRGQKAGDGKKVEEERAKEIRLLARCSKEGRDRRLSWARIGKS